MLRYIEQISMGYRRPADAWTAPSKEERLQEKAARKEAEQAELPLAERLNIATLDQSLPKVDFHGKRREDVRFEIDELLRDNPGRMVRIIYGNGSGAISGEVLGYLHQLSRGKGQKIEGFREDPRRASCVVKVK